MGELDDPDIEKATILVERLKRLTAEQFDLAININNKLFEVFSLQKNEKE